MVCLNQLEKSQKYLRLKSLIEHHLYTNYVSEYAICEAIIRPILKTVAKNYSLKVWSHVSYDVDKEKGLVGKPDYLIAARTKYRMDTSFS